MNANDPDDLSVLAGEYVLGVLSADDRREVETRALKDRALAAEIGAWQDRLLALDGRGRPLEPGAGLWSAIEGHLDANEASAPPRESANDGWWSRVGPWRAVSGLAVAACIALAAVLVGQPGTPAERYVAVLTNPGAQGAGWLVEVAAGRPLRLTPLAGAPAAVPEGKAMQLWTKIDGAPAPTSLGLVTASHALEVNGDRLPGLAQNQLFEITLEPATGSPTGRPTGPILFIGRSVRG